MQGGHASIYMYPQLETAAVCVCIVHVHGTHCCAILLFYGKPCHGCGSLLMLVCVTTAPTLLAVMCLRGINTLKHVHTCIRVSLACFACCCNLCTSPPTHVHTHEASTPSNTCAYGDNCTQDQSHSCALRMWHADRPPDAKR